MFRTLVDRVTLVPDGNEFGIVLRGWGDLAANLSFAAGKKKLTSAPLCPTSFRRPGCLAI
jgi:hypothetical protein